MVSVAPAVVRIFRPLRQAIPGKSTDFFATCRPRVYSSPEFAVGQAAHPPLTCRGEET